MAPTTHLALINLFIGDIQGGLGPFLGAWLSQTLHWDPDRIGLLTTISGLSALAMSGPFGALTDRLERPRLLIVLSCAGILGGTLLLLPATSFVGVLAAQLLAVAGGTMLLLAVTALTLGMVGKNAFPKQQGRNQAFNHVGILSAAGLITLLSPYYGAAVSLMVLGAMAAAAILATATTPRTSWNRHRAVGWEHHEPDKRPGRAPVAKTLADHRLLFLALALALFQLGNGGMLTLLAQKIVMLGANGTTWTAAYVITAQLTMVPVALLAGSLVDRHGRRRLLLLACLVLPVRGALSAFIDDPAWLILAEVLDGLASGIVGVAVPVVVADLTWGSGRTQTALGSLNAIQGVGGALSAGFGGLVQSYAGWAGAFLALGAAGIGAVALLFWLSATAEENPRSTRRKERHERKRSNRAAKAA